MHSEFTGPETNTEFCSKELPSTSSSDFGAVFLPETFIPVG
jgi:hypothetical protein